MKWINLETKMLDSETFIDCDPAQRGIWLCLMNYCAKQDNGGIIQNCKEWPDRKWLQLCGVMKNEAEQPCSLFWLSDDGDLHVFGYPKEKEQEVRVKSISGKLGGKGGLSKAELDTLKSQLSLEQLAELTDEQIAELRHSKALSCYGIEIGKGRELEKERKLKKEDEEKQADTSAAISPPPGKKPFWYGTDYSTVKHRTVEDYADIHTIADPIEAAMAVCGDYSSGMYAFLVKGCKKCLLAGLHEESIKEFLFSEIAKIFGEIKTGERKRKGNAIQTFIARMREYFETIDKPMKRVA